MISIIYIYICMLYMYMQGKENNLLFSNHNAPHPTSGADSLQVANCTASSLSKGVTLSWLKLVRQIKELWLSLRAQILKWDHLPPTRKKLCKVFFLPLEAAPRYPEFNRNMTINYHDQLVISTLLNNISQIGNTPPIRHEHKKIFEPPTQTIK